MNSSIYLAFHGIAFASAMGSVAYERCLKVRNRFHFLFQSAAHSYVLRESQRYICTSLSFFDSCDNISLKFLNLNKRLQFEYLQTKHLKTKIIIPLPENRKQL